MSKIISALCANLPLKSALKYAEFWKHALVTQVVSDLTVLDCYLLVHMSFSIVGFSLLPCARYGRIPGFS